MISYVKDTGGMCNITSTPSVSTSYKTFRLWVYFGTVVPKGSVVDVDFKLSCGPGTIGSVVGWFGIQRGQGYETSTVCSADMSFSYGGSGSACHSLNKITLTGDASAFCVDVTFSSRTSTSVYLNINGFSITGTAPDPVVSGLDDLNTTSNSLLDNIKNLFTGQSSIFSYLKSIYNYVKSLHVNIANSISGFFTSLGNSINETMSALFDALPEGIKDKLTSLFSNICVGVDNVSAGIRSFKTTVSNLMEGLKTGQITLGDIFDAGIKALKTVITERLDFVKSAIDALSTTLVGKMITTCVDIVDSITSIPDNINAGIRSLFVPDNEFMQDYYSDWNGLLLSRFGALYEVVDLVHNYISSFSDYSENTTLQFPKVSVPLIGTTFELGGWTVSLVPDGLESFMVWVRLGTDCVATFLFLNGFMKRMNGFFGVV